MGKIYYPEARVVIGAVVENLGESKGVLSFPAIPRSLQIVRNSYKQPDSWSIEFDGKDFPIPPSLLRTGQVAIYLYDKKGLAVPQESARGTKPAIIGLLDSVTSSFSSDGRIVTFEGQDLTALFAGSTFQRAKKGKRNLTNKRLDLALDQLRKEVDLTNQMKLVLEIPFDKKDLPIIGKSVSRTNKKGFPVKRGDNYWNVMYNLALKHGFLLFVRGLELVLATPDSILQKSEKSEDRTFKLTWGENIEQISMSRQMGKERVPQIEVLAYDATTRKTIAARFPEKGQKVATGVGTKRNEVLSSIVYGITDKRDLLRLAKAQHSLIGRSEQTVDFTTRELVDEGNQNLIFLQAGDAFFLSFDPFNAEDLRKIKKEQRVQWLVQRGWTAQAAGVFAEHFERLHTFRKPFYVREVTIAWDKDDGMTIDASVVNFVNVEGTHESGEVKGAAENA